MRKAILKTLFFLIFIAAGVLFATKYAHGQGANLWKLTGGNTVEPNVATWGIKVPALNSSGTKCLQVNASGVISAAAGACGAGSPAWGTITGTLSDQTDLQAALDLKVPTSRTITAGAGLTGGGDLSANRSFAVSLLGIQNLIDPNADRIMFWDDSSGFVDWLTAGTGLTLSGTTLSLNATGDWTGTFDGQEGTYYLSRANHTGTQTASTISDFSEASDDRVAALIQNGTGLSWSYVDASNTLTGNVSLSAFSTSNLSEGSNLYFTDERAQDAIGAMVDSTLVYTDVTPLLSRAALTGAITASAGSNTTALGSFTTSALNTALSDNDVATLAGIESLTNKKLGSLTSNGFVKTSGGDGTLSVDTNTYLTGNQTITLSGDVSGSGTTAITTAIGNNKVTGAMIALGSDAQGDIMYYNGTDWVRLAAGTSGEFLKTQGVGANPVWGTPAGSGDITDVGNCSTGACFTGSSGTSLTFDDADGDQTISYNTTDNIFNISDGLRLATGKAIQTARSAGNTLLLTAWDVDGASATTFGTLTANNTPTFDLSSAVTVGAGGVLVGTTNTQTLTNKTIDLTSNTITGTTAQFNTALSDNDFATLAGTETLTNKTLTAPKFADLGFLADPSGNEYLILDSVASAVNELTIGNAATGNGVFLKATGGDTDVALSLDAKGAGAINIGNTSTGSILIAGGSGSTGCTITTAGALTCSGAGSFSNLSGTNTGDQTSIVGITGTTAQFNTALSDNDFATLAGTESLTNKKLGSLTSNGFVKTSGGDGTLSVDTNTYLTGNQTITLSGDVSGSGTTAITTAIGADKVLESMLKVVDTPADEECLTYEATGGDFEWQNCSAGAGDITSVGDVASGAAFDGTQGTTLTFDDADGDKTFKYDTTNNWFEVNAGLLFGAAGMRLTGSADGDLTFTPVGDGTTDNDEDFTINAEDTANTIAISSSTGVTEWDFGTIDVNTDTLDLTGTGTINGLDAIDATSESTIEASIDTLANLTSVQGQTLTLAGAFITSGANSLTLTTTGTTNVTLPTTGTLATLAGTETLSGKTLTTPKFADLGYIADANGNEMLVLDTVASAVPYLQLANNSTGNNPVLTGAGEANTGLDFATSGAGAFRFLGNATQAGQLRLYEDADDGSNYTAFKAGTQAGDVTYTLPTGAPASNGYVLSSTTAGVLSWAADATGAGVKLPTYIVSASGGDYTTIQGALDACTAGGTIFLNDASYSQGGTGLRWKGSHCHIIGRPGVTTISFTGATSLFKTNAAASTYQDNSIEGVIITGDGNTSSVAVDLSDMVRQRYQNIIIDNVGVCFKGDDTQNITFYNRVDNIVCTTVKTAGVDFVSTNPVNDNIFNNIFIGCNANCEAVRIRNGNNNKFYGLKSEPSTTTGTVGVHLYDAATGNGTFDNQFYGSYLEANGTGILIDATLGSTGGVTRNSFWGGIVDANTTDITDNGTNTGFFQVDNNFSLLNQINSIFLGSAGVKLTGDGDGAITLLGAGNGNDEDLTINLDDTANTWAFSSSTGVTAAIFGGIALSTDTLTLTGTGTINGLDAIDATSESTIEAAIDTLANLTSVQGQTVSLSAPFTVPADPNADRFLFWDDSAGATAWLTPGNGITITTTTVAIDSASDTVDGIVELATAAETTTGTDATRAVTPDGLAGSDYGKRHIQILVTDPNGSAITTGDGKAYFRIPSIAGGYNLVGVAAHVTTVSSSGTPTVQIANVTQAADMLSTKITIDASEKDSSTAAAAAVIDTANDDVATGDELRVDIDVAGTGAKGLIVDLDFQLP